MREGDSVGHSDHEAPELAPNEGEYRTPTWYAPFPKKDGHESNVRKKDGHESNVRKKDGHESNVRKYGEVEQRAFDIQVTSPVDDVEALFHRKHLTAQFHAANREYWEKKTPYVNDSRTLYDKAILDLFEDKLACEGIDPSESTIAERRLKTLFLRFAREQTGTEQIEYLKGANPVVVSTHNKLGYERPSDVPSYDSLQREFRKFSDEDDDNDEISLSAFQDAVTRAVFSVYRAGIIPPDAVTEEYGFTDVGPPLDENAVSRETEKEELRRFVEELLDRTTPPLTFGRKSDETQHDMEAFIGAFAASALFDHGLEGLKDVCDWNYPRENIPGGGWPYNYISNQLRHHEDLDDLDSDTDSTPVPTINAQFDAVHNRMLHLASTLGFWSDDDPINLGVDIFRVDWSGEDLDATISRPEKPGHDGVTEQWTFVLAGGIDTESRFILGGRWIDTLSDYPAALSDILSTACKTVPIDSIFVDAEIVGGELIETLRRFVGDSWVISAPNKAVVKGIKRLTPEGYVGFARNVKWNVAPTPNVVTYPTDGYPSDTVRINPDDILTQKIQGEGKGRRISIPLDTTVGDIPTTQSSLSQEESLPWLTQEIDDLESEPGIGSEYGLAAYLTDRSLPANSASGIRFQYIQRWAIEDTLNRVRNDFMPKIHSNDSKLRLYGTHIAILFYNWYILINRCISPTGLRLDVSPQELLQAILNVCFSQRREHSQ